MPVPGSRPSSKPLHPFPSIVLASRLKISVNDRSGEYMPIWTLLTSAVGHHITNHDRTSKPALHSFPRLSSRISWCSRVARLRVESICI